MPTLVSKRHADVMSLMKLICGAYVAHVPNVRDHMRRMSVMSVMGNPVTNETHNQWIWDNDDKLLAQRVKRDVAYQLKLALADTGFRATLDREYWFRWSQKSSFRQSNEE